MLNVKCKRSNVGRASRGIAALVTVITITIFLIAVGFLVVNRGGSSIFSGQYESQATHAQFLADTGVQDGLIKLARDKDYTGTYSITDTGWTVDVAVTSSTVTATSTVALAGVTIQRTIRAAITMDADGKITSISKSNL